MKAETALILVGGLIALLWFASAKGLIASGAVPVGKGVYAPQPAQNYSGYLAASTAPAVSGALSTILSGVAGGLSAWLHPKSSTPAPAVRAAAPTSAGYNGSGGVGPSNPLGISTDDPAYQAMISGYSDQMRAGYDQTSGSAFSYDALALDNAFDPNYSLDQTYLV